MRSERFLTPFYFYLFILPSVGGGIGLGFVWLLTEQSWGKCQSDSGALPRSVHFFHCYFGIDLRSNVVSVDGGWAGWKVSSVVIWIKDNPSSAAPDKPRACYLNQCRTSYPSGGKPGGRTKYNTNSSISSYWLAMNILPSNSKIYFCVIGIEERSLIGDLCCILAFKIK